MRDGVKLNTKIFVPAEADEPLPFVLLRTPYGIDGSLGAEQPESSSRRAVAACSSVVGRHQGGPSRAR